MMGVNTDLKQLEKKLKEQLGLTGSLIRQLINDMDKLNCTVINLSSKIEMLEKSGNIVIADREGI